MTNQQDRAASDRALCGRRCLLVEDEALVAMAVKFALEDAGMVVVGPVASLSKAVEVADAGGFDVAVLDVAIKGGDVFPAADILTRRGVPIVFHTGHGERSALCQSYPAARMVRKPVTEERLSEELALALLEGAAMAGGPSPALP